MTAKTKTKMKSRVVAIARLGPPPSNQVREEIVHLAFAINAS